MTSWDTRTFTRALAATTLAMVVVWLVTAATDEGNLTLATRATRVMPIAPLASAVGAALALGTARLRDEARALEALGRSPRQIALSAALGAALPSVLVAFLLATWTRLDVQAFYPRAPRAESFTWSAASSSFESAELRVRVGEDGEATPLEGPGGEGSGEPDDAALPRGGRVSAALATALAGAALAVLASRAVLTPSLEGEQKTRRRRLLALALGLLCALSTLVAFQAAAARVAPAFVAVVAPALLLVAVLFGYRDRHEHAR